MAKSKMDPATIIMLIKLGIMIYELWQANKDKAAIVQNKSVLKLAKKIGLSNFEVVLVINESTK